MPSYTRVILDYIRRLHRTKRSVDEIDKLLDDVFFEKLSVRQYIVLHALSLCKDFAETADYLSKAERKTIKEESVRKRAKRAMQALKRHIDDLL